MSRVEDKRETVEVSRLLAGAAKTIASVRYCWLVTESETGRASLRPMGRVLPEPDENEWTIRFITDGRSRKAFDIRRASKVGIIFQNDADDAFVTLIGTARLREGVSEIRQRWKAAYNAYFSSEQDRANAAFVEVDIERMELWIRDVTPEPFGLHPTMLERVAGGAWRLISGHRNAA
jgi:general stress protein 26